MNNCRNRKRLKRNFLRLSRPSQERLQPSLTCNPESTCSSDIPGFYYDAEKKRYFRLLPGNNNSNPVTTESIRTADIKKLKETKSSHCVARARLNLGPQLRHQSLSTALLNPQRGFASPSSFCAFVQQERMSNLNCVSRIVTQNVIELPAEKCKYLYGRPEDGMVVGAWSSESEGLVIHSLSLDEQSNSDESVLRVNRGRVVNIHPSSLQLADLSIVEVSPKLLFVLYAGSYMNEERASISTMHLLPVRERCDTSTPENRELMDSRSQNYEFAGKHLWSCHFNEFCKSIYAGGESVIDQYGVQDGSHSKFRVPNENVFSLCTDTSGQTLYAGTNKGQLIWFDTRSNVKVGTMKIGRGTSYLKVLADESKIVASSFDDNLVQVDLRERKVLLNYSEHKNDHRKLPFSVDEFSNILCSVGQDKITRLWSLRDGKMLSSVLPEMSVDNQELLEPWIWYSDHWKTESKSKAEKSCLVVAAENELFLYCPK